MDYYQLGTLALWIRPKESASQRLDGWKRENLEYLLHNFFSTGLHTGSGSVFFSSKKAPLANSCLAGFYSYRLLHVLMMAFSLALSSLGMIVVSFGCFCQPLQFPLFCPHLCKWPFIGLRLFTPFECAICVLLGL